jgi:hypothetical protein
MQGTTLGQTLRTSKIRLITKELSPKSIFLGFIFPFLKNLTSTSREIL